MKNLIIAPQRMCAKCREYKPLNAENWRRNKNCGEGFDVYCKSCAQKAIKFHYRKFSSKDKAIRGKVGVKCLLWSPRCGVCPCISENNVSACWRIENLHPKSIEYPRGLKAEAPQGS